MSNKNKAMYVFSESAKRAIVKARTFIGDDALHQILKCAFDQINVDALHELDPPNTLTDFEKSSRVYEDKRSVSRVLQIFANKPGTEVCVISDEDAFGVKVACSEKARIGYTEVDIYTAIQDAAKADITGFILEALQLCSNEPISLHDADILSEYINKCKEVIGLENDDKGVS